MRRGEGRRRTRGGLQAFCITRNLSSIHFGDGYARDVNWHRLPRRCYHITPICQIVAPMAASAPEQTHIPSQPNHNARHALLPLTSQAHIAAYLFLFFFFIFIIIIIPKTKIQKNGPSTQRLLNHTLRRPRCLLPPRPQHGSSCMSHKSPRHPTHRRILLAAALNLRLTHAALLVGHWIHDGLDVLAAAPPADLA